LSVLFDPAARRALRRQVFRSPVFLGIIQRLLLDFVRRRSVCADIELRLVVLPWGGGSRGLARRTVRVDDNDLARRGVTAVIGLRA
jgi:hypothetical protein